MYDSYKKIFTGALMIFLDINLMIDILPDIIGYILIISALKELYIKTDSLDFKKSRIVLYPLVPISLYTIAPLNFYTQVMPFSLDKLTQINSVLITLSMTLLTLSMYYFYTATLPFIRDLELYNKVKSFKNLYVYSNFALTFVLTFNNYSAMTVYKTIVLIGFLMSFIVTIAWLFNLRNLRNYFETSYDVSI